MYQQQQQQQQGMAYSGAPMSAWSAYGQAIPVNGVPQPQPGMAYPPQYQQQMFMYQQQQQQQMAAYQQQMLMRQRAALQAQQAAFGAFQAAPAQSSVFGDFASAPAATPAPATPQKEPSGKTDRYSLMREALFESTTEEPEKTAKDTPKTKPAPQTKPAPVEFPQMIPGMAEPSTDKAEVSSLTQHNWETKAPSPAQPQQQKPSPQPQQVPPSFASFPPTPAVAATTASASSGDIWGAFASAPTASVSMASPQPSSPAPAAMTAASTEWTAFSEAPAAAAKPDTKSNDAWGDFTAAPSPQQVSETIPEPTPEPASEPPSESKAPDAVAEVVQETPKPSPQPKANVPPPGSSARYDFLKSVFEEAEVIPSPSVDAPPAQPATEAAPEPQNTASDDGWSAFTSADVQEAPQTTAKHETESAGAFSVSAGTTTTTDDMWGAFTETQPVTTTATSPPSTVPESAEKPEPPAQPAPVEREKPAPISVLPPLQPTAPVAPEEKDEADDVVIEDDTSVDPTLSPASSRFINVADEPTEYKAMPKEEKTQPAVKEDTDEKPSEAPTATPSLSFFDDHSGDSAFGAFSPAEFDAHTAKKEEPHISLFGEASVATEPAKVPSPKPTTTDDNVHTSSEQKASEDVEDKKGNMFGDFEAAFPQQSEAQTTPTGDEHESTAPQEEAKPEPEKTNDQASALFGDFETAFPQQSEAQSSSLQTGEEQHNESAKPQEETTSEPEKSSDQASALFGDFESVKPHEDETQDKTEEKDTNKDAMFGDFETAFPQKSPESATPEATVDETPKKDLTSTLFGDFETSTSSPQESSATEHHEDSAFGAFEAAFPPLTPPAPAETKKDLTDTLFGGFDAVFPTTPSSGDKKSAPASVDLFGDFAAVPATPSASNDTPESPAPVDGALTDSSVSLESSAISTEASAPTPEPEREDLLKVLIDGGHFDEAAKYAQHVHAQEVLPQKRADYARFKEEDLLEEAISVRKEIKALEAQQLSSDALASLKEAASKTPGAATVLEQEIASHFAHLSSDAVHSAAEECVAKLIEAARADAAQGAELYHKCLAYLADTQNTVAKPLACLPDRQAPKPEPKAAAAATPAPQKPVATAAAKAAAPAKAAVSAAAAEPKKEEEKSRAAYPAVWRHVVLQANREYTTATRVFTRVALAPGHVKRAALGSDRVQTYVRALVEMHKCVVRVGARVDALAAHGDVGAHDALVLALARNRETWGLLCEAAVLAGVRDAPLLVPAPDFPVPPCPPPTQEEVPCCEVCGFPLQGDSSDAASAPGVHSSGRVHTPCFVLSRLTV